MKTKNPQEEKDCNAYLGKEINIYFRNSNCGIVGKFVGVDANGMAHLLPSVVSEADGKRVRLETKIPTTFHSSGFYERDVVVRHLGEGYLERHVEEINRRVENERPMGFRK